MPEEPHQMDVFSRFLRGFLTHLAGALLLVALNPASTYATDPAPTLKPSTELGAKPEPATVQAPTDSPTAAPLDLRIERDARFLPPPAVAVPAAAPSAPSAPAAPSAEPTPPARLAEPQPPSVTPPAPAAAAPSVSGGNQALDPRRPITRAPVRVGDIWAYLRSVAGAEPTVIEQQVVDVNKDGISLKNQLRGSFDSQTNVYSREWNLLASGFSDYDPPLAYYSFSLYPGKKWRVVSSLRHVGQRDQIARVTAQGEALEWEEVEVPAGKFLTLKVRVLIEAADPGEATRTFRTEEFHWYARDVMRPVRVISVTTTTDGKPVAETIELVAFRFAEN